MVVLAGVALCIQEAECTRLQSGLQYKSEAKITEAINRLQHQLQTQNFKLNEEKKIVAEIDMLKRSRKDLGQVDELSVITTRYRPMFYYSFTTVAITLWPLYRTICVTQHPQFFRTGKILLEQGVTFCIQLVYLDYGHCIRVLLLLLLTPSFYL